MNTKTTIQNILIISTLLFIIFPLRAQYLFPKESKMELLGKSDNMKQSNLFGNDLCNVFLFTEKNVICSVGGELDSLPFVTRVNEAGECKTAFLAGEKLIAQRKNEIVSLSQDMNSISQSVQEVKLLKYGKRDIRAFCSNNEGFFIVEYKSDKKTRKTVSVLSYFHLSTQQQTSILEAEGKINCVSGDTAVMCFGLDSNLIVIANRQPAVLAIEKENITAVAPSVAGIFYGTPSAVNFLTAKGQKITIVGQGARQLIDNCNTLYMILEDGSLLRLLNTMAFIKFNTITEEKPHGNK